MGNKLTIIFVLLIITIAIGLIEYNKEKTTADSQWFECYSKNSNIIKTDLKNIEEARSKSDMVALSKNGGKLYYDSCNAIKERNMIDTSRFSTPEAVANDEKFCNALNYSKEAGFCIVSEVYKLKQGQKGKAEVYKYQASVDINSYNSEISFIDTDIY